MSSPKHSRTTASIVMSLAGLALPLVLMLLILTGCGEDAEAPSGVLDLTGTCVSCHENAEALQALAVEDDVPEDSGEG